MQVGRMRIAVGVLVLVALTGFGQATRCSESAPAAAATQSAATAAQSKVGPGELVWRSKSSGQPRRMLEFVSLRDKINAGQVQLSNGQEISDANLWAAVAIADVSPDEFCTATLVGPHVLLTAAHCLDAKLPGTRGHAQDATVTGTVSVNGLPLHLKGCEMNIEYARASLPADNTPRTSEDYGLCEIKETVTNLLFESLFKGASSRKGDAILMAGYGCVNIRVSSGEITFDDGGGILRIGEARIEATSVWNSSDAVGVYIRTRTMRSEPILCPGDSGGPVFLQAAPARQDGPQRRVMAVNSKVSAVPSDGAYAFLSFMAPVTTDSFQRFATEWVAKHKGFRDICGYEISPGLNNCRA